MLATILYWLDDIPLHHSTILVRPLVFADVIKYDLKRLDGLLKMEPPTTGSNIQQLLCALQWLKNGIPQCSDIVKQLQDFMRLIYDRAGKNNETFSFSFATYYLRWIKGVGCFRGMQNRPGTPSDLVPSR
eukprot:IDg3891t1